MLAPAGFGRRASPPARSAGSNLRWGRRAAFGRHAGPSGIRPLTPHIGAEIEGVDLSQPLSQSQKDDIRQAWLEWQVLVFRNQELTREQHKDFGRSFGPLHVHPLHQSSEYKGGHDPEILVVKTTQKSKYTAGDGWHTDVSCDEKPPMASMLYIKEIPECGSGGDTLFADMYRAYETLTGRSPSYLARHRGAGAPVRWVTSWKRCSSAEGP